MQPPCPASIVFYLASAPCTARRRTPIVYFRNTITPLACFHIAIVAASLYRVELRKSLVWLGAAAIVYRLLELIFKLNFSASSTVISISSATSRRQIETGVWEKTMHETGFVTARPPGRA